MAGPSVAIDLAAVEANARIVTARCAAHGIAVAGVTKGTCGMPEIAQAMLRGGVACLGESRLDNIARLREAGINASMMLLRVPALSEVDDVVRLADISLNSELRVIRALADAARRAGVVHRIVLMLDLGDLREGIWPSDLMLTVGAIVRLPGVQLIGLGTNLNCLGGVLPTQYNMAQLVAHAEAVRARFGLALPLVSAGNSGALPLLLAGGMPPGVNHLRIGEAILQGGRDTFFERPWSALRRDAFTLSCELIELKKKPSMPIGERGVDAFGTRPHFSDDGERLRGILDIGQQDVHPDSLVSLDAGVRVVGASSDHLVVDLTAMPGPPRIGQRLRFAMGYGSLLRAMTSPYVGKHGTSLRHGSPPFPARPMEDRRTPRPASSGSTE